MTDERSDRLPQPQTRFSGILARVLGPVGPEVTCEQCFELLDRYVDLELAHGDADGDLPGMRAHLEGCPACHEDYKSLREMAGGTPARFDSLDADAPAAGVPALARGAGVGSWCGPDNRGRPPSPAADQV